MEQELAKFKFKSVNAEEQLEAKTRELVHMNTSIDELKTMYKSHMREDRESPKRRKRQKSQITTIHYYSMHPQPRKKLKKRSGSAL